MTYRIDHLRGGRRALWLATAAMAACLPSLGRAQTAAAETAVAAADASAAALALSEGGLSEVIVTAQKRATNLQKTPISISVASAEELANRRVQSLADLGDGAIPSLRVSPFFSRNSALTVGIRGIVPFDANQPSRDAAVGVYLDGVYLGRSQGLGAALYDIERIEVLKGPQGTLFGRNSTGGAVSIVTRAPSGEFRLKQTVGARNFGGYSSETHLDLPAYANVSLKFDAIFTKRDGTVRNPMAGEPGFNSYDRRGFHARALWQPSDKFSADYGFDVSYDASTPYYLQLLSLNPGAAPLAPAVKLQTSRAEEADIGVPQQLSVGDTYGHMLHLTWKPFGDVEVRSITSYRKLKQTQFDDGGGHSTKFAPNSAFSRYSLAGMHQDQYSEELQVVGSLPQLTYVVGAYYYHEAADDFAWTPNTLRWNADGTSYSRIPTLVEGQQTPYPDRFSTALAKSVAVFGQATWTPPALNDALHLTVGARWTKDDKSGDLLKSQGVATPYKFSFSSDRVDPAVTLAYDASDAVHLYAKWGSAYRAGGANSRSLIYRSFGPETVKTSEIGLKSEFWDRRVRLNLAAYDTRYNSIQIDFSAVNFVAGRNIGTLETVNTTGQGRIKGIEADLTFAPMEGLTLNASYAYTKTRLPPAPNPFANNALQTVYIVYTPKNAFSASIDYQRPLERMTLIAHLDANAADGQHALSSEANLTGKSFVVNGRLALGDIAVREGAKLQLSLWARNLFNEDHTFVVSSNAGIGGLTGIFNEPRTYGLDASIQF
ncbi:MAG: TonB-dependent receptor [Caulobacteraceae bacterium]